MDKKSKRRMLPMEKHGKPICIMYAVMSIDGKISMGGCQCFDKDIPMLRHARVGYWQYRHIADLQSMCVITSGEMIDNFAEECKSYSGEQTHTTLVVIDNNCVVNQNALKGLTRRYSKIILYYRQTAETVRYAQDLMYNMHSKKFVAKNYRSMSWLVEDLYRQKLCVITLQGGGKLNSKFLRDRLVDEVHLLIAPMLVGGKKADNLVSGGIYKKGEEELQKQVVEGVVKYVKVLDSDYIEVCYQLLKDSYYV